MNRHNERNRLGGNPGSQRQRRLYVRATAVVVNKGRVLLVKHNREDQWALPGGQVTATEEPSHRAVLEVAEETGILIDNPLFIGRYAGTVAAHQIFLAQTNGEPQPNRRELQDARWWDGQERLDVQQHVSAILAMTRNWLKNGTGGQAISEGGPVRDLPELKQLMEGFEDIQ